MPNKIFPLHCGKVRSRFQSEVDYGKDTLVPISWRFQIMPR